MYHLFYSAQIISLHVQIGKALLIGQARVILDAAVNEKPGQRILVGILIQGAHAVAIVKQGGRIAETHLIIRRCHYHGYQINIILPGRGGQAIFRLAGGTGFQARGPLVLLQQLIGAGKGKGGAAPCGIVGDILHPDHGVIKNIRMSCNQFP